MICSTDDESEESESEEPVRRGPPVKRSRPSGEEAAHAGMQLSVSDLESAALRKLRRT